MNVCRDAKLDAEGRAGCECKVDENCGIKLSWRWGAQSHYKRRCSVKHFYLGFHSSKAPSSPPPSEMKSGAKKLSIYNCYCHRTSLSSTHGNCSQSLNHEKSVGEWDESVAMMTQNKLFLHSTVSFDMWLPQIKRRLPFTSGFGQALIMLSSKWESLRIIALLLNFRRMNCR